MNPAASGANSHKTREALTKLDWMGNVNLFDNETGSFWRGPGMDPSKIKTEVFFLPAAVSAEKEGSITNSGRWMQWRYGGPKPLGESKPDGDIIYELAPKIRELYAKDNGAFPAPIKGLNLDDWGDGHVYDPHKTARLINGYYLEDVPGKAPDGSDVTFKAGTQVASFANLKDDGSTCCGNWIYCGSYTGPEKKDNKAAKRSQEQTEAQAKVGLFPNWSWSWPVNRRIIYNRASVNEQGVPYQPQKPVLAWEPAEKKWIIDVVDGGGARARSTPSSCSSTGWARCSARASTTARSPSTTSPWNAPSPRTPSPKP